MKVVVLMMIGSVAFFWLLVVTLDTTCFYFFFNGVTVITTLDVDVAKTVFGVDNVEVGEIVVNGLVVVVLVTVNVDV